MQPQRGRGHLLRSSDYALICIIQVGGEPGGGALSIIEQEKCGNDTGSARTSAHSCRLAPASETRRASALTLHFIPKYNSADKISPADAFRESKSKAV